MERIASFCVDHTKLDRGMYLSRQDGDVLTWDIRMKRPNHGDYLSTGAAHTLEHLFATYARNSAFQDSVIYVGPMGCRTGFYLLTRGLTPAEALELTVESFRFMAGFEGAVPGASEVECGNYRDMDLPAAKAEAADWQDKYVRLHAEWDTYRRRMTEQREAEKVRATEKLMESLIPVLDDFARTVDYAETNGETGLLGGVKAVQAKLSDTLAKGGLVVISPAGEAFDALECQAVGTVDDPSVPDETVAQVYQPGYKMGTKVIRPAMVTITTGGPKREKPEEE
mgnify:FL=1